MNQNQKQFFGVCLLDFALWQHYFYFLRAFSIDLIKVLQFRLR